MSTATQPVRRSTRRLRDALRSAISRGEVVPYYQPIVDMRSGRVLRFEALARWPDPSAEWVPPMRFVPLAEQHGLIGPLLRTMLEQALRDAVPWLQLIPDLRIAVNISPKNLGRTQLAADLSRSLEAAGATADWLSLEITENVVLKDVGDARRHIVELRSQGMRIEIDDFGTGYASLKYLQTLAIDAVKIDRQFVEAAVRDETSEKIVRAVIDLCHQLGFEAVAEGVSDPAVWDLLSSLGCDSVQGYLVSPPLAREAVGPWLDARQAAQERNALEQRRGPLGSYSN